MSRATRRAIPAVVALGVVSISLGATGCEDLKGRSGNRKGSRLFRETQFIEAAAEYERALTMVKDPIIHYNLGLTYQKVVKPGTPKQLLGIKGTFVCEAIPGVKETDPDKQLGPGEEPDPRNVCVKDEDDDHRYTPCDRELPKLATQSEAFRMGLDYFRELSAPGAKWPETCPSSATCRKVTLCYLPSSEIADMAASHFLEWLKANPDDADTRKLMTQVWLDSEQFGKALDYWKGELAARPNDAEIMGIIAGINLKAGDYRASVEWYAKQADAQTDPSNKVAALKSIGNVAWAKLNSKTLSPSEVVELADAGLAALERAIVIQPQTAGLWGLQASIFNFRSLAHGVSWASALDRTTAQDLQKHSRVLIEQAKKAQETTGAAPGTPSSTGTTPSMSGGPANKAGG